MISSISRLSSRQRRLTAQNHLCSALLPLLESNDVRGRLSSSTHCLTLRPPIRGLSDSEKGVNSIDFQCFRTRRRTLSTLPVADEPQDSSVNHIDVHHVGDAPPTGRTPTIEERYSRKTPLEHILLRPGMYVGPTERLPATKHWVVDTPPLPPSPSILSVTPSDFSDPSSPQTAHLESAVRASPSLRLVLREISYIPALLKVFDEILVNAADQRLRHPRECTRLDVTIDPGCAGSRRPPLIRVTNNGPSIPIQIHKGENLYVPDLLFGHLLTGSNFDDSERRVTGGRHGYGAKLANIFSAWFQVETAHFQAGQCLMYQQAWSNNMRQSTGPIVRSLSPDERREIEGDYTCISFVPDTTRLSGRAFISAEGAEVQEATISPDDYALMCRRVLDVAGCNAASSPLSSSIPSLRVILNGIDVTQKSFADYCQLYRSQVTAERDDPNSLKDGSKPAESSRNSICFHAITDRWIVGVGKSEAGSLEAISFVNGMSTPRGGTHVNALLSQVCKRVAERAAKLDPEIASMVSPALVRRHLFLCVNALIENPSFDSQMKECLTSSPSSFGSSCELPDKFLDGHVLLPADKGGPGIVEEVIRAARGRQQATLLQQLGTSGKKTKRQLMSMIPKLEDAHLAGTEAGWDCTLILTEGDSAKALAVAGLEEIGRDRFGVFPLRGKFLNVRHATVSQLATNGEIRALCAIVGLEFDKEYATTEERRELRYGHIMLMTDQDTDGSHIKGLVINFFRHYWPKLLQPPVDQTPETSEDDSPFLSSFVTPLLKATKKGKKGEVVSFYNMAEYLAWRELVLSEGEQEDKKWSIKYYKGLGTSTPAEAKAYFAAFDSHYRPFYWRSDSDGELLDMVFDNKRASDRRNWILDEYDDSVNLSVDPSQGNRVSYEDFVNKEMIHFSQADNIRSIPSLVDGLKPSQRKVLYACFKRNLKSEIKVAQLTGYCAEHTAYHHGEASLQSTIIGMAQDFVGSNNINLLVPSGQFGTRLAGGEDAASPRYIFTQLSPIARYLFPEIDDALLSYREDDGQLIEPEYYCPVIPLLLVNGSQGIGTGWSTFVPPHNPLDVLEYIRAKLDGLAHLPEIRPYARGFVGSFEAGEGGYVSVGRATADGPKSVIIDELPLRCWTNKYKAKLLSMKDRGEVLGFSENHTTSRVSFRVDLRRAQLLRIQSSGLERFFKLRSPLSTTNMHAFGSENRIERFETAQGIADAFFPVRLQLYHDRKLLLESSRNHSATMLRNKARFIESVTSGKIELASGKKSKSEASAELKNLGFATASDLLAIRNDKQLAKRQPAWDPQARNETIHTETEQKRSASSDFDYLLNMPLSSLTVERISELRRDADQRDEELRLIQSTTAEDLWRTDLDNLATMLQRPLKE